MEIRVFRDEDSEQLAQLLANNEWPFHSQPTTTFEVAKALCEKGHFNKAGTQTFLVWEGEELQGYVRVFDLGNGIEDDETPLFDIRIKKESRGEGLGTKTVAFVANYVFKTFPNKIRLEATTRFDNAAMISVLEKLGFVKEAHYRKAWKLPNGDRVDAVGFALLREEWGRKERII